MLRSWSLAAVIVLPLLKKRPDLTLLAVAYGYRKGTVALRHELYHDQFFGSEVMRDAVAAFWDQAVSVEDRGNIKKILSPLYNTADQYLVLNEFQAMMLEGPGSLLGNVRSQRYYAGQYPEAFGDYVAKYRAPLLKILEEKGIRPVETCFNIDGTRVIFSEMR